MTVAPTTFTTNGKTQPQNSRNNATTWRPCYAHNADIMRHVDGQSIMTHGHGGKSTKSSTGKGAKCETFRHAQEQDHTGGEMSRYRTTSNGFWEFLEYSVQGKFLWWTYEAWRRIPRPYYNWLEGRANAFGLSSNELYVNSLHENLKDFVSMYPDISAYWPAYTVAQAKIEESVRVENSKIARRKTEVKYL